MIRLVKADVKVLSLILGICLIYFLVRLPNLTLQPIFADEAIYIRWAQVMKAEPSLRFLPLSDGKTPLFMWLMIPLFKIFPDPLFAGRALSLISGFFSLFGILLLGWKFFDKKVGILAAFLVAIVPFMVFFDRMALVDSMLAAFSVWALNLGLLLVKYLRFDLAMLLGYSFGAALLTKPSGIFDILVLPITAFSLDSQKLNRNKRFLKLISLWIITVIITLAIYSVLKLAPNYVNIGSRTENYLISPAEFFKNPLDPFLPHLKDTLGIMARMFSLPLLVFLLPGVWVIISKKDRVGWVILLWSLIPMFIQMAGVKAFTARYILFSIPALLVISTLGLIWLSELVKKSKTTIILLSLIIAIFTLSFDLKLLTSPEQAPLPVNEKRGYFEDWTAGYGLRQIALFLQRQSENQPVVVGTNGSFGTLPDGLEIYLDQNKNIAIVPGGASISAGLRTAALDHPTFFVTSKSQYPRQDQGLTLIRTYPKAAGESNLNDAMLLFQVFPLR